MLNTTAPKIVAEASTDKLWGTGIPLRDSSALDSKKWENQGWLLEILLSVRDEVS